MNSKTNIEQTYRTVQVVRRSSDFTTATQINSLPLVEPSAEKLRVRVIYTGINLTDVNVCLGRYFAEENLPHGIGFEALGTIDAIGNSIPPSAYTIGQPVIVFDATRFEAFTEYLYIDPRWVTPIPALKPEYLIIPGSGLTAAIGLDCAGRVKPGDKVLVIAAAGGTGSIAAQWAKHRGGYVIGTTSTEEKAKFLNEIGIDCAINYRTHSLRDVLREKFPDGIDVIWETIGGDSLRDLFEHLAPRGRLAVIGSTHSYANDGIATVTIDDWNAKLLRGSKSITGFALFEYAELFAQYFTELIEMISSGKIIAKIDLGERTEEGKFVGLESLARAEKYLAQGRNIGKVIVQVQDIYGYL